MKNVALITGASSGIGMELARIHASKGGDLVLVARREAELHQLAEEIQTNYNRQVCVLPYDLMKPNAAKELFQELTKRNIEVDILINNAGLGGYGKFHDRSFEKEQEMIFLNIHALTELTHLILPQMIKNRRGKILNTASTAGFMPGPLQSVYFATKAFVVSFSQGIAHELREFGITVTALCPGPVKTGFEKEAGMEGSGLFKNAASASSTAMKGYKGMEKGRLIVITDRLLSVAINWLIPLVPRRMVLKIVEQMQTVK